MSRFNSNGESDPNGKVYFCDHKVTFAFDVLGGSCLPPSNEWHHSIDTYKKTEGKYMLAL